eukprot:CAMPEP_0197391158 /NCGR_PEP_ID=MMETSP1165-20131217/2906_1 /TAXON_ID=284809 /ORGANISM="Chrysocystis fragilis, Strain CCMP3189" /LENGTH=120 /DNA_ID=CAMNT_0042916715 /DNA_START=220 /DNA_END=578 /DNA_ORIENTATION=+
MTRTGPPMELGGRFFLNLAADNAVRPVRPHHSAPDNPELRPILLGVGLVHVRDALPKVEVRPFLILDTLNLDQVRRHVLVPQAALVTKHDAFHVQSHVSTLLSLVLAHSRSPLSLGRRSK